MTKKHLYLKSEWCKGCGICVALCPKHALIMKDEKAFLNAPKSCVRCGVCELHCPDYAIFIAEEEQKDE